MRCLFIFFFIFSTTICAFANNETVIFTAHDLKGDKLTIAAVGDILLHSPLQSKGMRTGFKSLWEAALPYLQTADIAYANLEGPIANGLGYSGYPAFNYPPSLAQALKESGFDIVSTANNHALDRANVGVQKTLQNLNRAGVFFVGTRSQKENNAWVRIIKKNNITTAWIACTEHTNGIDDTKHAVLYCSTKKDRALIFSSIQSLKNKVDAIIVTPHWGEEYATQPSSHQKKFAHELLNAGATLILGSHPHVLQPMEKFITDDGRETFVIYSLGNFVSYQGTPKTKTTIILLIELIKESGKTMIKEVQFVPMEMKNREGINKIHISKTAPGGNETTKKILPQGNVYQTIP